MKYKFKKIYLFISLMVFLGSPKLVEATLYNGEGHSGFGGSGGTCKGVSGNCLYNNSHHKTIKVSLYYFSKTQSREKLGNSIYLTSNSIYSLSGLDPDINNIFDVPGLTYENAKEHFMDNNKFKDYIAAMGIDINTLTADRVDACTMGGKEYGYRVIIEPALTVYKNGRYYLKTVKEIASDGGLSCQDRWDGKPSGCNKNNDKFSVSLYTVCDDVGVKAVGTASNPSRDLGEISSLNTGYGYNIIDPSKGIGFPSSKRCYKINQENNPAVCTNVGKHNIGTFKEVVNKVSCNSGDYDENATENGKLVYEGNNCSIHCLESAQQIFPGSLKQKATIGAHLVWPTGGNAHEENYNQYSLSIFGKTVCTIEGTNKSSCTNIDRSKLYNFDADIELKWNDGEKEKTAILSKSGPSYKTITSGDKIIITSTINYKLNENFNRYIDLEDGSIKNNATKNYLDIGFGNLSVSTKAKKNQKYDLTLKTNKLGGNDGETFAREAQKSNYTCYYKAINESLGCECPDNSDRPGTDLRSYLGNGMTCTELKNTYCYGQEIITPPNIQDGNCHICEENTPRAGMNLKDGVSCDSLDDIKETEICDSSKDSYYYCPSPNEDINITSCLKAGGTKNDCEKKLCPGQSGGPNGNPDDLHCPNTNGVNDDTMDARLVECVKTKVGQGYSYSDAVDVCENQVCPLKRGFNVIYRVIDLHNPFPGKEFNGNVRGFNDANKGRYPGQNWNSKDLVNSKIRNNRKTDGDTVYNKEPLYRFVLTPTTIKEIRKYNKNHKYDDFNLSCKLNNSSACISSFVHNLTYGLKSGTCSNVNKKTFYTCNK